MISTILTIGCFLILAISAYTDIARGKVYSKLVLPAIGAGLILQLFNNLTAGDYVARVVVIVAIYFLYEGFIGGGDAKLVMLIAICSGALCGILSLGIASALILCIMMIREPYNTRASIHNGINALRTGTTKNLKGQGPTVLLAPYLLIAYTILVAFGVH